MSDTMHLLSAKDNLSDALAALTRVSDDISTEYSIGLAIQKLEDLINDVSYTYENVNGWRNYYES